MPIQNPTGATEFFVLGAAQVGGLNGSLWRTDLGLCHRGTRDADIRIELFERDSDNVDPARIADVIPVGRCVGYRDVVGSVLHRPGNAGALRITSSTPGLVVSARTYDQRPSGSLGAFSPGSIATEIISIDSPGVLAHLRQSADEDSGFRSNIEIFNTSDTAAEVELHYYLATADSAGVETLTVPARGSLQLSRVLAGVSEESLLGAYAIVRTTSPEARLFAMASVIDNRSGDSFNIPSRSYSGTLSRWSTTDSSTR